MNSEKLWQLLQLYLFWLFIGGCVGSVIALGVIIFNLFVFDETARTTMAIFLILLIVVPCFGMVVHYTTKFILRTFRNATDLSRQIEKLERFQE